MSEIEKELILKWLQKNQPSTQFINEKPQFHYEQKIKIQGD